jgi:hypothetical protein
MCVISGEHAANAVIDDHETDHSSTEKAGGAKETDATAIARRLANVPLADVLR